MKTTILIVSYFPLLFRFFFESSLSFSDERGVVLGAATGGVLAAFFAFLGMGGELNGVCSGFFAGDFCFDFGAPAAARFRVAGTGGDWNRARSFAFFFDGGGAGGGGALPPSLFRFFFDEGAAGGGASPSVKPG